MHPDFGSGLYDGAADRDPLRRRLDRPPSASRSRSTTPPSPTGPAIRSRANVPIEGGRTSTGDRHVIVVDRDTCTDYELFAAYPPTAGRWHAGSGAIFNLRSNHLRPAGWTSADAAGLPILPGLARYDEVARGVIDHALRFTAPCTRRAYVYPARHVASTSPARRPADGPARAPEGRASTSRACPTRRGSSPEALKRYGLILADNGSPWYISGAPNPGWNNGALHLLDRLHGRDFEVVNTSSLPHPGLVIAGDPDPARRRPPDGVIAGSPGGDPPARWLRPAWTVPSSRRPAGCCGISERDRVLLAFMADHRLVVAGQIAALLGATDAAATTRLRRSQPRRIPARREQVFAQPAELLPDRSAGLAIAGPVPCRRRALDPRTYSRTTSAWPGCGSPPATGRFGPLREILAERQLRSHDEASRSASDPPLAVKLGGYGPGGRERLHYPDLLLIRPAAGGSRSSWSSRRRAAPAWRRSSRATVPDRRSTRCSIWSPTFASAERLISAAGTARDRPTACTYNWSATTRIPPEGPRAERQPAALAGSREPARGDAADNPASHAPGKPDDPREPRTEPMNPAPPRRLAARTGSCSRSWR